METTRLDDLEDEALDGIRDAIGTWAAKQPARPVIANLVLYLSEGICEQAYCNVGGIDATSDETVAATVAGRSDLAASGRRLQKRACFDLQALPALWPTSNDFRTFMRFAHRICARLEATRELGEAVDVAPTFVAVPLQHDDEDIVDPKLRKLARQWLKQPAQKYMQSFGKK